MTPDKITVTKIAITGGPSGGKTTLIETLQKDMAGRVSIVPEAASILYRGGFPRKPSPLGRRRAQRAICFVQKELEDLISDEHKTELIVCDRGSLDSIAYWPANEVDFFTSLNTTREKELLRYPWVIHLDTSSRDSFDSDNPIRTESHIEAVHLNELIKKAWSGHPRRIIIPHEDEFLKKIVRAKIAIEMIMANKSYQEIVDRLFPY